MLSLQILTTLGILVGVYIGINIILKLNEKNILGEFFADYYPHVVKILPKDFLPSYETSPEYDKKNNLYYVNSEYDSGLCTDLDALSPKKVYAIINIPKGMKASYIKFFGTQERGRVGYNKIVKIRILEKFIDNTEDMPKLVALGSLNENIDLNIRDKNNNYLVAEIDIRDSVINGGLMKVDI